MMAIVFHSVSSLFIAFPAFAIDQKTSIPALGALHARLIEMGVDETHKIEYSASHSSFREVDQPLNQATDSRYPFQVYFRGYGQDSPRAYLEISPLNAKLMIKDMELDLSLKIQSPDEFTRARRDAIQTRFSQELTDIVPNPWALVSIALRFNFDHYWMQDETGGYNLGMAPRSEEQLRQILQLDLVEERLQNRFHSKKIRLKMTNLMGWSGGGRDGGPSIGAVTPMTGLTLQLPADVSPLEASVALYLFAFEALTSSRTPLALPPPKKPGLMARLFAPRVCSEQLELTSVGTSTALTVQKRNGSVPEKGGIVTLRTPLGDLDILLKRYNHKRSSLPASQKD